MTTVVRSWTQRTPIGLIGIESSSSGVRHIGVGEDGRPEGTREPRVAAALDAYFGGDVAALDALEVDLDGVPAFRRRVLEILRTVAPGEVMSYGKLAAEAGRVGAARAVGQAVGGNPVPLVVPCHRVIAADGTLGGFGLGLDRKRWLLAHEGVGELTGGWEKRRTAVLR